MIKQNPEFDRDYIVFFKEGDLCEEDFVELRKIYNKFIFQEIKTENYTNTDPGDKLQQKKIHARRIFEWTQYKVDMFSLQNYEQVIWFDIDMVVLRSLHRLFQMRFDDGILACEDIMVKPTKGGMQLKGELLLEDYNRDHLIQGGVVIVGKNVLNKSVYRDLLNLCSEAHRFKLNDQSMFIEYFGKTGRLKHIDVRYNCPRKLAAIYEPPAEKPPMSYGEVVILHYPGTKKPIVLDRTQPRYGWCKSFHLWWCMKREVELFLAGDPQIFFQPFQFDENNDSLAAWNEHYKHLAVEDPWQYN